jgi:hypothetical protein
MAIDKEVSASSNIMDESSLKTKAKETVKKVRSPQQFAFFIFNAIYFV